jgi:hypothetical protein
LLFAGVIKNNINPSTWNIRYIINTKTRVFTNAVIYSAACHDSPSEFNSKTYQQRVILDDYIRNNKGIYMWIIPPPPARTGWTTTIAPSDRYDTNTNFDAIGVWENYVEGDGAIAVGTANYYPYRPGFASWNNDGGTATRSAGVDCVGLVQRSASYAGNNPNNYLLPDIDPYTWDQANYNAGRKYIVTERDKDLTGTNEFHLWEISASILGEVDPSTGKTIFPNLDRIIPGDVVYYRGYHVMMVHSITYEAEKRSTSISIIRLIEANWPSVINTQTVQNLEDNNKSWVIGRLITN